MTRPGGYVEVVEIQREGFCGALSEPVPAQEELCSYLKALIKSDDMVWNVSSILTNFLRQCGFQDVNLCTKIFSTEGALASTTDGVSDEDEQSGSLADDALTGMVRVYQSYKPRIVGANLVSGEKYDALIDAMRVGWRDVAITETGRGITLG